MKFVIRILLGLMFFGAACVSVGQGKNASLESYSHAVKLQEPQFLNSHALPMKCCYLSAISKRQEMAALSGANNAVSDSWLNCPSRFVGG